MQCMLIIFFFFKQKTAYEMRISDWSSDVCSSDLFPEGAGRPTEHRIDWYTEGLHIYRNTFKNNGNQLSLPTLKSITSSDVAKLLPVLIGLKNQEIGRASCRERVCQYV